MIRWRVQHPAAAWAAVGRWFHAHGCGREIALVAACVVAAAHAAAGATYYVAVTGSDAGGTGTSASPWATITHALDEASDGSLILVRPGTYTGTVALRGTFATGVTVRSETPYAARLRQHGTVVTCYYGQGITLEGFDIAHDGAGAGALVIQIQDLRGAPGGSDVVSRITLRNNILHDSWNNDILKINNGAAQITVEGNMFYNQTGHDEHIDINGVSDVVVQDNVFFNDFAGSGRAVINDTGSFIVIKDSNGSSDGILGSHRITVRRNVLLNWQGSEGSNFVLAGEDGQAFHEAVDVLVENNLLLGNSPHAMRAAFGVKGGRNIVLRHNTISGDLPASAYAMRLNVEGANPANENVQFYGNVWSDATGTMGAGAGGSGGNDFSDTPAGETASYVLNRNAYWNGGAALPSSTSDVVNIGNDAARVTADPKLNAASNIALPRWRPASADFGDGSTTIRQAFERLGALYGTPAAGSSLVDAAQTANAPTDDLLGRPRPAGAAADLGAVERGAAATDTGDLARGTVRLHAEPNPFRGHVSFRFTVTQAGSASLQIYDVAGRIRRTFDASGTPAAARTITWDGRDDAGRNLPAGIYFARIGDSRLRLTRLP